MIFDQLDSYNLHIINMKLRNRRIKFEKNVPFSVFEWEKKNDCETRFILLPFFFH